MAKDIRQKLAKMFNYVQLANPLNRAQGGTEWNDSDRLAYRATARQQNAQTLPTPEKIKGYNGFGDPFQVLANRPHSLLILPDVYAGILSLDDMTAVDKPSPYELSTGKGGS